MDALDKEALEYKDPIDDELEQDMADMEFYDLAHSMAYTFDQDEPTNDGTTCSILEEMGVKVPHNEMPQG